MTLNIKKVAAFSIFAFLGYSFIRNTAIATGSAIIQNVSVERFKIQNVRLSRDFANPALMFDVNLDVKNDNPLSIPFNASTGDLLLGDLAIGQSAFGDKTLVAQSTTNFISTVTVTGSQLGQSIVDVFANPDAFLTGLRWRGNLNINGIPIPVNERLI